VHPAVGSGKLFGVYAPQTALPTNAIAPLLNSNHLSGYLNLVIVLTLGQVLTRAPILPRWIAGLVLALLGGCVLWVGSRGAVASLALVVLTMLLSKRVSFSRVIIPFCLGIGAFLVAVLAATESTYELASKDVTKFQIFRLALSTLRRFVWFGSGRGAFESVFRADNPDAFVATHPENLLLQWTIEWGVPVAFAALVAIGYALKPRRGFWRTAQQAPCFFAVVVVALQNLVDFSLEVPGVVLPVLVCVACAVTDPGRHEHAPKPRSPRHLGLAVGLAAALFVVGFQVFLGRDHELFASQRALRKRVGDGTENPAVLRDALRMSIGEHPAEPYFPFLLAYWAEETKVENPIPWVGQTLRRAKQHGRAHLVLARALRARSSAQSRMEYRIALEQDSSVFAQYRAEAPSLVHQFVEAEQVLPATAPAREWAYSALTESLAKALPATVAMLDETYLATFGQGPAPEALLERSGRRAVTNMHSPEICSDTQACASIARPIVERLIASGPDKCAGYALRAEAEVALKKDGALAGLEDNLDKVSDKVGCIKTLAALSQSSGDRPRTARAIERLLGLSCTATECAERYLFAAGVYGGSRTSLMYLRKAVEQDPNDASLLRLGTAAESFELWGEAADVLEKLAGRDPRYLERAANARSHARNPMGPALTRPKKDPKK
jgi:hypothetical protein